MTKASSLHRDQVEKQRYMVGQAGAKTAANVCITLDFLEQAKTICVEEIGLIDEVIKKNNIPFPKTIPRTRPIIKFTAELLSTTQTSPAFNHSILRIKRTRRQGWQRFVRKKILHLLARTRVSHVGRRVLESARCGPVAIVGEGIAAFALARFFIREGRDSVILSSGYGDGTVISPGYLQRPAKDSFIGWVLQDHRNLEKAGAVVFIGNDDFTFDIDTLRSAHSKPPFFFIGCKQWGRYEFMAIHPEGLSKPNVCYAGKDLPRISIVIVSFNQAKYLEAAIRSVISQNYPNLDLIIVDGGSEDGSIAIIERYRSYFTHVVIEPDEGQSHAINKGFSRATGEIMNWLCSDDMLEPDALHCIAEAYVATRADLIVGGCVRFGETRSDEFRRHHTSVVIGQKVPFEALDFLRFILSWEKANYFYQPEVFFSRRIWYAAGGYIKNHLYYVMDYDLWFRMALAGASIYHIPAMIGCSRIHARQKTQENEEYMHQVRQLMEEYLDLFCALEEASTAVAAPRRATRSR
jgi:GT2 family glycosyltransferase